MGTNVERRQMGGVADGREGYDECLAAALRHCQWLL